jgi:hypothetical protein
MKTETVDGLKMYRICACISMLKNLMLKDTFLQHSENYLRANRQLFTIMKEI